MVQDTSKYLDTRSSVVNGIEYGFQGVFKMEVKFEIMPNILHPLAADIFNSYFSDVGPLFMAFQDIKCRKKKILSVYICLKVQVFHQFFGVTLIQIYFWQINGLQLVAPFQYCWKNVDVFCQIMDLKMFQATNNT